MYTETAIIRCSDDALLVLSVKNFNKYEFDAVLTKISEKYLDYSLTEVIPVPEQEYVLGELEESEFEVEVISWEEFIL